MYLFIYLFIYLFTECCSSTRSAKSLQCTRNWNASSAFININREQKLSERQLKIILEDFDIF